MSRGGRQKKKEKCKRYEQERVYCAKDHLLFTGYCTVRRDVQKIRYSQKPVLFTGPVPVTGQGIVADTVL